MTHDPADLSDEVLVALCQTRGAKDDRPFAGLFRRHHLPVWRICYRFTGNAEDAEDLTQEIFFKAYRSLATFEGRSTFKTWLYRIAINTCKNELRSRQRQPRTIETPVETLADVIPGEPFQTGWLDGSPQDNLGKLLTLLRPEEVEVLTLRDLEQRSYAEIADFLGVGLSAAKMRVQRARLALQAAYQQTDREEGPG